MDSYLTPTNIQPYHLLRCAEWMTNEGYFSNKSDAFRYLCFLSQNNTPKLLVYFNNYMQKTEIKRSGRPGYIHSNNCDKLAFISASGPYGEKHMNFAKI